MKRIIVEAQNVRIGDRIWWFEEWTLVKAILPASVDNHIELHVGSKAFPRWATKHRRESVAVQREETT
jgi:hypothetical protein